MLAIYDASIGPLPGLFVPKDDDRQAHGAHECLVRIVFRRFTGLVLCIPAVSFFHADSVIHRYGRLVRCDIPAPRSASSRL